MESLYDGVSDDSELSDKAGESKKSGNGVDEGRTSVLATVLMNGPTSD